MDAYTGHVSAIELINSLAVRWNSWYEGRPEEGPKADADERASLHAESTQSTTNGGT